MFVTEDTTRARPETLRALYGAAIACGARRVCLADTVGHATPDGVRALVRFVREEIIAPTKLDGAHRLAWPSRPRQRARELHGRDRGRRRSRARHGARHRRARGQRGDGSAARSISACSARTVTICASFPSTRRSPRARLASRFPRAIRCSARMRFARQPACTPRRSRRRARRATRGSRTGSTPACRPATSGSSQRIDVSHVSGISNVRSWLEAHGHDAGDEALCRYILDAAKQANHTLRDDELTALIAEHRVQTVTA